MTLLLGDAQALADTLAPYGLCGALALFAISYGYRNFSPIASRVSAIFGSIFAKDEDEEHDSGCEERKSLLADYDALRRIEARAKRLNNDKMKAATVTIRDEWLNQNESEGEPS